MSLALREELLESRLKEEFDVTDAQIDSAKRMSASNHLGLLVNLQSQGLITDKNAVDLQSEYFGVRVVNMKEVELDPEVVSLLSEELRGKHALLPLTKKGNILTLATGSLFLGQEILNSIQKSTKCLVNLVLAYPGEIRDRATEFSKSQQNLDDMLEGKAEELSHSQDELEKFAEDPHGPVAQAVNFLITQAVNNQASDIHFEPMAKSYRIRYREDGVLREVKSFDKVFINPFSAAVKVKASIDIAETRIPQDGNFNQIISGRQVDFRVATIPTEFGEKIVIRVLDSNKDYINVDALMLPDKIKGQLIQTIENPHGLMLCAGPTGSGKSTTLYSILNHLNTGGRNILTIEDPIEYRMAGINQSQVNKKKGYDFKLGLRAMMRLDPDVILVGEMRDKETADIGMQAALTGHMVLSTVHANSATQTVVRLNDLGVEPFIVASALQGVISQRLLRRICTGCKTKYEPDPDDLVAVGFPEPLPKELYKGRGCSQCHGRGYRGRMPVMEVLIISNQMRALIAKGANSGVIFKLAREEGMATIQENGRQKVIEGLTTPEEVLRVLGGHVAAKRPEQKKTEEAEKPEEKRVA